MASSDSAYAAVAVDATAEIIKAANGRRESIVIKNNHADQILYIGSNADVTAANGMPIAAGESIRLETKSAIWGIGSGAATDTRYFEEF